MTVKTGEVFYPLQELEDMAKTAITTNNNEQDRWNRQFHNDQNNYAVSDAASVYSHVHKHY